MSDRTRMRGPFGPRPLPPRCRPVRTVLTLSILLSVGLLIYATQWALNPEDTTGQLHARHEITKTEGLYEQDFVPDMDDDEHVPQETSSTDSESKVANLILAKLKFRRDALEEKIVQHEDQRPNRLVSARYSGLRDEVIYSIQSHLDTTSCNARLLRELLASGISLRSKCIRCDFALSIIVDEPIYSFLVEHHGKLVDVFDRIELASAVPPEASLDPSKKVFASRKAQDLLEHAEKPFVVFLDADIYSNHRSFPESIFDLLHKDQDLIMPVDWAHRHGELFGRGLPGLCTCVIGYLNHPTVTRLFALWHHYMTILSTVDIRHMQVAKEKASESHRTLAVDDLLVEWSKLRDASELSNSPQDILEAQLRSNANRWLGIIEGPDITQYQLRDQEVFSLVLKDTALPQIRILPLGVEWVCANSDSPRTQWAEGPLLPESLMFSPLTRNPCKALHNHHIHRTALVTYPHAEWVMSLKWIGEQNPSEPKGRECGGAKRLYTDSPTHR